MTARRKTVEKPAGHGEIRLTDGKTIKVRYALIVFQTVERADAATETSELGGQLEIRGAMQVNKDQGLVELGGKTFTLKTGDKRCLEAWAKSGNPVSGLWEIVGSGPRGLEPC